MMEIVFVHLGEAPAKHLWLNISRIKRNFPQSNITVIYSHKRHLKKIEKLQIESFFYQRSGQDTELLNTLSHDSKFRKGFWIYSLERLLALEFFHTNNNSSKPILHLESDILLLPGFPLEEFHTNSNLSWCRFNETHDVSAILYSPNASTTSWLTNAIRNELRKNCNLTDMTVLSAIKTKHPEKISYLPSLHNPNSEIFKGIFDGAALGMWLTGRDPRNKYGLIQRHIDLPESNDNPTNIKFSMTNKDELWVKANANNVQVYNLHIHSKNHLLFRRYSKFFLKLEILRTSKWLFSTTFSPFALMKIVRDFAVRHRLNSFKVLVRIIYPK